MRKKPLIEPRRMVIGLDLSLLQPGLCTGYSPSNFKCDAFKMPDNKKFPHPVLRYSHISDVLLNEIETRGCSPARIPASKRILVMEDYAFSASGKTFGIAENGGILKYRIVNEFGLPYENIYLVSTGHLKMFAAENGNCKKEVLMKKVYQHWGYDSDNNDEVDAFILFQIGWGLLDKADKLSKYQQGIIAKIRKYNE